MAYNQNNPQPPLLPLPQVPEGVAPQHQQQGNAQRNRPRRNNRGGGQGQNQRNADPRVRPPRQAGAAPPPGPPRPTHLATTSTPERNDPLWVNSLAGSELQPMPNNEYVHSGCEALPTIISVMHASCVASSSGYARRVPESALAYYSACVTYARMLRLHMENGLNVSADEERFVEQVYSLNLEVPMLLAHYLAGFGNTRVPSGRDIRFRLRPRAYRPVVDVVSGWFGPVSAETQPLYQNYPCLAVFASRILVDVQEGDEFNRRWNIPPAMRPEDGDGTFPTQSMLGYAWRVRLSEQQRQFLHLQDIYYEDPFPSVNPTLPLSVNLLLAVQNELNALASLKRSILPTSIVGSQAQLGLVRVENELAPITEKTSILETSYRMPQEITFSASAFTYRVAHNVERLTPESDAPWVIWRLPQGELRSRMSEVGNSLRENEPEFIQLAEFHTTPYLLKARLEALEHALSAR